MPITLYCFGESGNAYKAALTLTLAGVPWTARFVDFFGGETRSPAYRAINVMGEVPVMEEDGRFLTQSGAIQLEIARRTGRFGGRTAVEEAEVLRWLLFDNHKLSGNAGTLRFLMNFLPADKRKPDVIDFMTSRFQSGLKILEAQLSQQQWLAADQPTIADFSNCSYLYYPEPFNFDRTAWPAIDAWLTRIASLPGWQHPYDLMPRGRTAP
jgi:glutathione S-transferase